MLELSWKLDEPYWCSYARIMGSPCIAAWDVHSAEISLIEASCTLALLEGPNQSLSALVIIDYGYKWSEMQLTCKMNQ